MVCFPILAPFGVGRRLATRLLLQYGFLLSEMQLLSKYAQIYSMGCVIACIL